MRPDAADSALAALALVDASIEGNKVNRENILNTTETSDLVVGLVVLAATLRQSLATAWGIRADDLDELIRAQYVLNDAVFGGEIT